MKALVEPNSPKENAAHACISNENDGEKNEEVEEVTGCLLNRARHQTHALLRGHSLVSTRYAQAYK